MTLRPIIRFFTPKTFKSFILRLIIGTIIVFILLVMTDIIYDNWGIGSVRNEIDNLGLSGQYPELSEPSAAYLNITAAIQLGYPILLIIGYLYSLIRRR